MTLAPDPRLRTEVEDEDAPSTRHWHARPEARALRATPFTLGWAAVLLLLGVVTGTLWQGLPGRPLYDAVAYGLPQLEAGRWWTPVTGIPFGLAWWQYLLQLVVVGLLLAFTELRLGTRRTAVLAIGLQVAAVLGAAALLALMRPTGWPWAEQVATTTGVGFWAGALGAAAAATVTLRSPWRARVRLVLGAYAVLLLLYGGLLRDLQDFLAVGAGLLLGPVALTGRAPRPSLPHMTRREWRLVAAGTLYVSVAVRLIVMLTPGNDSPIRLGDTTATTDWSTWLFGIIAPLLLAEGLRRGRRLAWRIALVLSSLITFLTLLVLLVLLLVPEDDRQLEVQGETAAQLVAEVVLWVVAFSVLVLARGAFRAAPRKARRLAASRQETDREHAKRILKQVGGSRLSWMTTWEGNTWLFGSDDESYVAYQARSGVAVALGPPVARDRTGRQVVGAEFLDMCATSGLEPCFFSVGPESAQWAEARGWRALRAAEEALIDLPELQFKGKHWQDVRSALNRATKEGVEFRLGALAEMPRGIVTQVRAISEEWVGDKGLPEMGFTLGGVDEAMDPEVRVGLAVDGDGTVHGVTSWLPVYAPGGVVTGWTLDVMRRLPDGFRPVTEYLIASSCVAFRDEGALVASLSGAPLASDPGEHPDAGNLDRLLSWLGEQLEPLYGFRSLDSFKAKFSPRHEPMYLLYRDEAALPRIGIALTRCYLPDASLLDLASAGLKARG